MLLIDQVREMRHTLHVGARAARPVVPVRELGRDAQPIVMVVGRAAPRPDRCHRTEPGVDELLGPVGVAGPPVWRSSAVHSLNAAQLPQTGSAVAVRPSSARPREPPSGSVSSLGPYPPVA